MAEARAWAIASSDPYTQEPPNGSLIGKPILPADLRGVDLLPHSRRCPLVNFARGFLETDFCPFLDDELAYLAQLLRAAVDRRAGHSAGDDVHHVVVLQIIQMRSKRRRG